jgi:NACalpha-BTF3-like transcription factor
MKEFEVSKAVAEKALAQNDGDLAKTIDYMIYR